MFANELHREHIEGVVARALNDAKLSVSDVDAVAVTNRPGIIQLTFPEIYHKN